MFDYIHDIQFSYVLCGIIWAVTLGFAVGNYACSLVHRLPRNLLMLDKTPYCGSCGTLLKVKDLFPVISAVLLRHHCRYCGAPFPTSHTWTELLVGLLFVFAFFQYGFTEHYILLVTIGTFLITLAAIQANDNLIMGKIILCILVFGMLNRVLADSSIYGFVQGGLFGLIAGAAIWRRQIKKVGHIYVLPPPAMLLAVGGVCVGSQYFFDFLLLFAALQIVFWVLKGFKKPPLITASFGFAVMLVLLYPKLTLINFLIPQ